MGRIDSRFHLLIIAPLNQKHIIWGTLLLGFTVISPLPTLAQAPIPTATPLASYSAHQVPPKTGALLPPKLPSPCGSACPRLPPLHKPQTYSFKEVWALTVKHQRAQASHFSPELITCLMWEESGFRLVENPRSHALGFGQVMPAIVGAINRRYNTRFTREEVLTVPETSVQVTILALELAWSWKKDKLGALTAYAGGVRNYGAVRRWLAGEPAMIQARLPDTNNQIAYRESAGRMIAALHLCSQPGFHPRGLFD